MAEQKKRRAQKKPAIGRKKKKKRGDRQQRAYNQNNIHPERTSEARYTKQKATQTAEGQEATQKEDEIEKRMAAWGRKYAGEAEEEGEGVEEQTTRRKKDEQEKKEAEMRGAEKEQENGESKECR